MSLPDRHSLLWKLIGVLLLSGLLVASLQFNLNKRVYDASARLPEATRQILSDYSRQAEAAWREHGMAGLDRYLGQLRKEEQVWAVVVDEANQSLSSQPVSEDEDRRLRFIRTLDSPVGRPGGRPNYYIPWHDRDARMVIELPLRLDPRQHNEWWELAVQKGLPTVLALLLGALLYRLFIAPITSLRRQASALSRGNLAARVEPRLTSRRDELGELARTFNQMAGRLENTVIYQRSLLRALSHELRTPLSRLRVAGERELDIDAMRQRQEHEVQIMERLIDDTLELVWLDTERPQLPAEPVVISELWDMLREDACFETGWSAERLPCEVPSDCQVQGNLNGLAQVFENILRNALRHSPANGTVRLGGLREAQHWHLWIEDQGPGVPSGQLTQIFQPFTRLNAERPGGDGFGLGLSIAQSVVQSLKGEIWAENAGPGLRLHLRLPSV